MPLIDTHCHLTYPGLAERIDEVLANCAASGVEHAITIASDVSDAHRGLELARAHAMISCTAGIHPHQASSAAPGDVQRIAELWADEHVVAIGEIGLDYHYDIAPRDVQRSVFTKQLELARERELPLVIHCREAFGDCIRLLVKHGFTGKPVVVHCFTGTAEEAARVADHGWRISFTGVVTFKKSTELQAIAQAYPADKLMVETDAPYLTPAPIRHVRPNEPSYVAHTARFIAKLRGDDFEAFATQTSKNAREFFRLPA